MRERLFYVFVLIGLASSAYLAASCVKDAVAQQPWVISKTASYTRSGMMVRGHAFPVATGATRTFTVDTAGVGDPELIQFGSLVVIQCQDEVDFCWSMSAAGDITIGVGATGGDVTDANGPNGIGACFRIPPNSWRDQTLWRGHFRPVNTVARRSGICSDRRPCRIDGDCLSGTCTVGRFKETSGAFLLANAEVTTRCHIGIEQ